MNKTLYLLLLLILALQVFLRMHFFDIAMERDEGIYTYFGQQILQGKIPYIDFYETRFPGIFYMYALLVAVFGYSIQGLATGILVLNLISTTLLFDTTRRLFSGAAGLIAAAAFTFLTLAPDISGFTRQSEHIVNFWAILGTWIMVTQLPQRAFWKSILAGASMCMAMLVKPNAVFLIPAIGLLPVLYDVFQSPRQWKQAITTGLWYSLGVFGLFGLMGLYIYSKGAWGAFYQFAIVEAGKYSDSVQWSEGQNLLKGTYRLFTEQYHIFMILSFLGLAGIMATKTALANKISVWVLYAAGFATITPGLRFLGHYWLMWMPFVAMAIGALAFSIGDITRHRLKMGSVSNWAPAVLVLPLLFHISSNNGYYFSPNFNKILERAYGVNPFAEVKKLAEIMGKKVQPGDKVAVVGSEPQVFVYTKTESPTRHAYFTYLMADTLKTPEAQVWQKEFISDVETTKPRFIFFTGHPVSVCANVNSDMRFFEWFFPYVNTNYNRIGCADLISDTETKYVLTPEELKNFQPKSKFFVDVYERK